MVKPQTSPRSRPRVQRRFLFVCLFGVLRRFQHCTGHITTGSWKGRGNQYIQFVRVLYCKLPTNGKQPPAFPLEAVLGIETRPQRLEARVLPLCHSGPLVQRRINDILLRYNSLPCGTDCCSRMAARHHGHHLRNIDIYSWP